MPYQYTLFEDVSLPVYNPAQDHSPMEAASALLDSVGGAFDWRGASDAQRRRQTIPLTGIYWGETEYWVDETGDRMVDENGDYLIWGDAAQTLRAQVDALRGKVKQRGQLWCKRFDDDALTWKTARFMRMSHRQVVDDKLFKAEITCEFETAMEYWHASTASEYSVNATDGVAALLIVDNGGETVRDALLTIACTSGTVTAVAIACAALGIDIDWTGSLASGTTLAIDEGDNIAASVGTDAYSGFSLGAGHTAAGWLPIDTGTHGFDITVTGGNATVTLQFYEQWA